MTVEQDKLIVVNPAISTEFNLAELESMRFSEVEAGISPVFTNGAVEVFSVKGEKLGSYKSFEAAKSALQSGPYIFHYDTYALKVKI